MAHTQRGEEIILDENCHIFNYEVAALAVLSAVQARGLRGRRGILTPQTYATPSDRPTSTIRRTRSSASRARTIAVAGRSIRSRHCGKFGGLRRSTGFPFTWTARGCSTPVWPRGCL